MNQAEDLARQFHETYERLAPEFGYETREASRKPWEKVPEQNRRLMAAVCQEIILSGGRQAAVDPKFDPRTVYYGPHPCGRCGGMICKASADQGGAEYDYPAGPLYPNTEWEEHRCAGSQREEKAARAAAEEADKI